MENNFVNIGNKCTGCRACAEVCHNNAISFETDKEGFIYPRVDEGKCVNCGMCRKTCSAIVININQETQEAYAAYLKDRTALLQSTSGGIFAALAQVILKRNGIVVGCGTNEDHLPVHKIVKSEDELWSIKNSKYAQSNMEGIYGQVLGKLEEGSLVLFSGTPCQVAGLKNLFPNGIPDNLVTCDIVCHGVPSRWLLQKYFDWLEKKNNGKINSYNFRSKNRNDWSLTYSVEFQCKNNRKKIVENIASIDPYYDAFLNSKTYRESCYVCPYSQKLRPGDITIGDFWGIEKEIPEFNNINGVSAVLVNSNKGKKLFDEIASEIEFIKVSPEVLIKNNGNLNKPSSRPNDRYIFYQIVERHGFDGIFNSFKKTKRYKLEMIRNLFPNYVRQKIKAIIRLKR